MTDLTIDIGIDETDRRTITEGLSRLLADTYTLYLKTHNYHWNVTGPMFQTLHLMFETQYNELALAVDLIAERIRALGSPAPGSYREFTAMSSVPEDDDRPDADRDDPQARRRPRVAWPERPGRSSRSSNRHMTNPPPTSSPNASRSTRRRPGCSAASSTDHVAREHERRRAELLRPRHRGSAARSAPTGGQGSMVRAPPPRSTACPGRGTGDRVQRDAAGQGPVRPAHRRDRASRLPHPLPAGVARWSHHFVRRRDRAPDRAGARLQHRRATQPAEQLDHARARSAGARGRRRRRRRAHRPEHVQRARRRRDHGAAIIGYEQRALGAPESLVAGRYPTADGEGVANETDASEGFGLGDVVRVEPGGYRDPHRRPVERHQPPGHPRPCSCATTRGRRRCVR